MNTMEKINHSDNSLDFETTKGHAEQVEVVSNAGSGYDNAPHFDAQRTKKLLRKLDWNLVPFLALLYLYESPFPAFILVSY